MDMQKWMDDYNTNSKRQLEGKAMSPNSLLEALKDVSENNYVVFWNCAKPGEFQSYRGSYCELALSMEEWTEKLLVKDFRESLRNVDWSVYEWYKWGDFKMTGDDTIHVANYWETSDLYIEGVALDDGATILNLIELDI